MARVTPLSDAKIKSAKPKNKEYKLPDGDGLYICITPKGSKIWRLRYVLNGKKSIKSLGKYPNLTLLKAREEREDLRKGLNEGIKPGLNFKEEEITFAELVDKYFKKKNFEKKYDSDNRNLINRYYGIYLNNMYLKDIEPRHIIQVLKDIDKLGYQTTAKKSFSLVNRIFQFAVSNLYTKINPVVGIGINDVISAYTPKNHPHITDEKLFIKLLLSIENYFGDKSTRLALQLLPYIFLRSYTLRYAEWNEFNFDKKEWIVPASKMKNKRDHLIPLTESMINILNQAKKNNISKYVFPSPISTVKPLSENTLNNALSNMGFKDIMVTHGFRHTASTFLHENMHMHKVSSEAIEVQMAHKDNNTTRATYNKAIYIEERTRLMVWWSNYLDNLKSQTLQPD